MWIRPERKELEGNSVSVEVRLCLRRNIQKAYDCKRKE